MRRSVLLLALVPLLVLSLREAVQYDPYQIEGMFFSADGRELKVLRGDHQALDWEARAYQLQVWNVTSRRLVRTSKIYADSVAVDQDGEVLFAVVDETGEIRQLDANSLKQLRKWHAPSESDVLRVEGTDWVVVAESRAWSDGAHSLTCMWVAHGVENEITGTYDFASSGDGRRLFLTRKDPLTNALTTDVFVINETEVAKEAKSAFPGKAAIVSRSGGRALVTDAPSLGLSSLRDLRTGTTVPWNPPANVGATWGAFFSLDGSQFHAFHQNRVMTTHDVASGRLVAIRSTPGSWFEAYSVSPDQRLIAGTSEWRKTQIWDLTTGKVIARLPDHRVVHYSLAAAFVVWCTMWIGRGVERQSQPAVDIFVVYGIALGVLFAHAATRPHWEVHPALIAISLALLTALATMLCLWWIHGRIRWSLRLAGMFAGLAALAATLLTGHRSDPGVWNIMLGAVSYLAVVSLLLMCWRWRGLTITRNVDQPSKKQAVAWQLPLKDALIVTSAVALLLAVLRLSVPGDRSALLFLYVSCHGVGLGVSCFVAAWAALRQRRLALRIPLLLLVGGTTGLLPSTFYASLGIDPLWWCVTFQGSSAAAVFLSLGAFRTRGVRLAAISPD